MYFLIGLGIILVIVYANSLYDYIKEKKAKKEETENQETAAVVGETGQTSADGRAAAGFVKGIILSDMIEGKLKNGQNIFGLPLKLCEKDETGKIVAVDREDNIYVIETNLRPEFEDFYQQVREDMNVEKRRIGKGADLRKVYGIVCVDQPSELLMAAAKKQSELRIYRYDVTFENII